MSSWVMTSTLISGTIARTTPATCQTRSAPRAPAAGERAHVPPRVDQERGGGGGGEHPIGADDVGGALGDNGEEDPRGRAESPERVGGGVGRDRDHLRAERGQRGVLPGELSQARARARQRVEREHDDPAPAVLPEGA